MSRDVRRFSFLLYFQVPQLFRAEADSVSEQNISFIAPKVSKINAACLSFHPNNDAVDGYSLLHAPVMNPL
jgi:hypothetical protein